MSLSTLLEAANYLEYLDSNNKQLQQQQQPGQQAQHSQQPDDQSLQIRPEQNQKAQPTPAKRSSAGRRQRSSKKDAANTMVAMSLPTSTGAIQMQHGGVPIPLASGNHGVYGGHHHASLSSSFTTESPLSSFASTALLCSKASGVTSASSSAASSLSSSDSSSSCGEILMGDNDLSHSTTKSRGKKGTSSGQKHLSIAHQSKQQKHKLQATNNINLETNNQHLQAFSNQSNVLQKFGAGSYNDRGQSFARYIAATSTGPQLVTMTTNSSGGITSASAPIDGRLRAGHVIHAATQNTQFCNATAAFDHQQYSIQGSFQTSRDNNQSATFSMTAANNNSLGSSDNHLSTSPGTSCAPLIMTRVQPMILNSISPSAHQTLMAFQPNGASSMAASSPTSSSSSYSRHRELHKTLEKNRRAHLRHCFELLKSELPISECVDKKTSHINIIKSAIRYVMALRQQECELDNELSRLSKVKNELTERLSFMSNISQSLNNNQQINQQQSTIDQFQMQDSTEDADITGRPIVNTTSICDNASSMSSMQPSPPVVLSSPASPDAQLMKLEHSPQQPAAEQQLSLLLSQSKID